MTGERDLRAAAELVQQVWWAGALSQPVQPAVYGVLAAALAAAERAVHDRYQALAEELEAEGRALKASGGRTAWLQGQKIAYAAARVRACLPDPPPKEQP